MNRLGVVSQRLLREPFRETTFQRPLHPRIPIRVQRHTGNPQPFARMTEADSEELASKRSVTVCYANFLRSRKIGVRFGVRLDTPTSQTATAHAVGIGGEGRNRAPLGTNDTDIMPDFIGYSSRLCHYWNSRFTLGLLAILLAIFQGGGTCH